jgi:3-dehydroquinate synthetase
LNVIKRSISIKADIVSQDVRETKGIRSILNYGHTVGHAIESVTGYDSFLHGEAVSIGMMAAAHLSNKMGFLDDDSLLRHEEVLKSFGLPVSCHGLSVDQVMSRIQVDKKTSGGDVKWVLLESIGKAITNVNVPNRLVKEVLDDILS